MFGWEYNCACMKDSETARFTEREFKNVEVSGQNLESSQTSGFYLRFLPFYKMLFSKLEFSSLIDYFVWILKP
jgi:hypothetical protein